MNFFMRQGMLRYFSCIGRPVTSSEVSKRGCMQKNEVEEHLIELCREGYIKRQRNEETGNWEYFIPIKRKNEVGPYVKKKNRR